MLGRQSRGVAAAWAPQEIDLRQLFAESDLDGRPRGESKLTRIIDARMFCQTSGGIAANLRCISTLLLL